jgi:membrane protein
MSTAPLGGNMVRIFLRRLYRDLLNANIPDLGAMMAYYAILSLFPMLLVVVTIALIVVPAQVLDQGVAMATGAMPPSGRDLVASQVHHLVGVAHAGFAVGGALIALWGASRGAAALGFALNTIFQKHEGRSWWHRQVIAIAVTLGVALLTVVALALLVIGPRLGHAVADQFGLGSDFDLAWSVARWLGAGLLIMVVLAIVYKFLPDTTAPFRVFTPGAIACVLVWLGISWLFGLYLDHFNSFDKTYGALGGAIIFLTWLWLSNIAILFGAVINAVVADVRVRPLDRTGHLVS